MSSTTLCAKCLLESAGDTSANPQDGRAGATPLDTLRIGDLKGSIEIILCCGVTSTPTAIEPSMPRSNDGGSTPRSAHQKTPSFGECKLQPLHIINTAKRYYNTNHVRTTKDKWQLPVDLLNFFAGVTSVGQTYLLVGM